MTILNIIPNASAQSTYLNQLLYELNLNPTVI